MHISQKTMIRIIIWAILLIVLTIICCYSIVSINASNKTFDNAKDIPNNEVGLLLGTSPRTPENAPNYYYINRIIATAELYKGGKISKVIASGGDYSSHQGGYNELEAMRDSLIEYGVPDSVIILDYEGTRTLNSIVKVKEIYGYDNITLISQKYHNERAIYLALQNGINAIGYNAKPSHIITKRIKNEGREFLARVKLFIDMILGEKPTFKSSTNNQ